MYLELYSLIRRRLGRKNGLGTRKARVFFFFFFLQGPIQGGGVGSLGYKDPPWQQVMNIFKLCHMNLSKVHVQYKYCMCQVYNQTLIYSGLHDACAQYGMALITEQHEPQQCEEQDAIVFAIVDLPNEDSYTRIVYTSLEVPARPTGRCNQDSHSAC